MSKQPTTIRLEPAFYKQVLREAKKTGLSFSDIVHLLLRAFTEGAVQIGVTQYPKGYLEMIGREAEELRRFHRKGKVKKYASAKEAFDDILGR
ncbi:MAG: hypothetical protein Greene041619_937 [Candidatus Peregrinibacteria bacterium Greene0416_19]|nr:MAG: hypothetical protein Greene041619_937 [Candidatus Peregrinibacteria bacterium Greene0416_19]